MGEKYDLTDLEKLPVGDETIVVDVVDLESKLQLGLRVSLAAEGGHPCYELCEVHLSAVVGIKHL